jgi:pyruvate formate lyase activating enzyme
MSARERDNHKGLIFNIQKFSIHDGPGIRTTVFTKGCPLGCKWCSNPESISSDPEIMIHDIRCIHCGKCQEACPEGAIISIEGNERIDMEKCTRCMECVNVCPTKTLEIMGRYMTIKEVVEEVEKDSLFYQNSGGGVTLSGGEPLFQWRFTRDVLRECKERGFHTALDTTGYVSWKVMEEVLRYVDLILYDIKHMDDHSHTQGTGVSNTLILKNIERIASMVRTWIRFPVIQGFNDSPENIKEVASLASMLGVEKVSLLPYHEWGRSKYEKLGREYPFAFPGKISSERLEYIRTVFSEKGVVTTLKG